MTKESKSAVRTSSVCSPTSIPSKFRDSCIVLIQEQRRPFIPTTTFVPPSLSVFVFRFFGIMSRTAMGPTTISSLGRENANNYLTTLRPLSLLLHASVSCVQYPCRVVVSSSCRRRVVVASACFILLFIISYLFSFLFLHHHLFVIITCLLWVRVRVGEIDIEISYRIEHKAQ